MRQRVMIAIALACDPKLLIADEPTTALDVTIQAQILEIVRGLRHKLGMGIVWITHDLGLVAGIADRVIVMYAGQVVEHGPVATIFATRSTPTPGAARHGAERSQRARQAAPHDRGAAAGPDAQPGLLPVRRPLPARLQSLPGREPAADPVDDDHDAACWWIRGPGSRAMAPKAQPLVRVSGLKMHFPIYKGVLRRRVGEVKAVDDVSFDIAEGETLGLVGESGCGKIHDRAGDPGALRPDRRPILIEGRDIAHLEGGALRALRPKMQMIFQDPQASLNPRMTVGSIIAEPLDEHAKLSRAERRARVMELMDAVGLNRGFANRYPHEFSGGQRQRIGIARALALNPKFIVCDEPIAALDVSIQAQVVNLLEDLQESSGSPTSSSATTCRWCATSRPGGGDVPRADRRDRAARGALREAAAPLHPGADLGGAEPRPGDRGAAQADRPEGRRAEPGNPPRAASSTPAARRSSTAASSTYPPCSTGAGAASPATSTTIATAGPRP